ncbi:Uncharacterized protein XB17_03164 [Leptospira santarosai]|nr:Uncharacterized protein XB17_03164 [Leptospira santarosai]
MRMQKRIQRKENRIVSLILWDFILFFTGSTETSILKSDVSKLQPEMGMKSVLPRITSLREFIGFVNLPFPFTFQKAKYNIHCNYILKNRNVIFTDFKRELSVHNSESFQVRLFLGFPKKDRLFEREVSNYLSDGI